MKISLTYHHTYSSFPSRRNAATACLITTVFFFSFPKGQEISKAVLFETPLSKKQTKFALLLSSKMDQIIYITDVKTVASAGS